MPRPIKFKRVCRVPLFQEFTSENNAKNIIVLSIEEYETIRLIDYVGLTQEECAKQMKVSRITVQNLYMDARKKVSRFLVEGTKLQITGGNYQVCDINCCKDNKPLCFSKNNKKDLKGDNNMKIAVTYEDGLVFQHFGHTGQFKLYEIEAGKIVSSEILKTDGSGHGALAGLLQENNVNVLICGGIGGGAKNALAECGIELYAGAIGNTDAQVESFLLGKLSYNPNVECNHHNHEHSNCKNHGGECGHHS